MRAVLLLLLSACRGACGAAPPTGDPATAPLSIPADARADWRPTHAPNRAPQQRTATPPERQFVADVVGPVAWHDVVLIGSTAHGFVAIDPRSGRRHWRLPVLARPARPWLDKAGAMVWLASECSEPATLGCLRAVSRAGEVVDEIVVTGDATAFSDSRGPATLAFDGAEFVWQRGDSAIRFGHDGRAHSVTPRRVTIDWRGSIGIEDDNLVARRPDRALAWQMDGRFAAVVGIVPGEGGESPTLRTVRHGVADGVGYLDVLDFDAAGSKAFVAWATSPGIALLDHAINDRGDTLLSVRRDASLAHDYLVHYGARGDVAWTFALPDRPHVDPARVTAVPGGWVAWWDALELGFWPD